jgi:transitional endoplasmic reticulum ATPase
VSTMAGHITKARLMFLGRAWAVMDPETDPFAQTKLDYALNLLVGGVVQATKHDLGDNPFAKHLLASIAPNRGKPAGSNDVSRRLDALAKAASRRIRVPARPREPLAGNLGTLAGAVGLTEPEISVLTFALACREPDLQGFLISLLLPNMRSVVRAVSVATTLPPNDVEGILSGRNSRLAGTRLLVYGTSGDLEDRLEVDSRLRDVLIQRKIGPDELLERFLPRAAPPTLSVPDFQHVAPSVDLARRILRAASRHKRPGINMLLVGPTGTGKSELSRLLAAEADLSLFVAGQEDESGDPPNASERLTSLLVGNRVVDPTKGILLFDEMEDLFQGAWTILTSYRANDNGRISKQWFTRLLETNPVPTIWVSNDVKGIDPAYLRRFSFVIEMPQLSALQRRRAWLRHLDDEHQLSPSDIDRLVSRFEVSPAEIGNAVATTRLASEGLVSCEIIEAVLEPTASLVHGRVPPPVSPLDETYDPSLVNATMDVGQLAARLGGSARGRREGIALLLHGPPGTGKSGFVQHLARCLDRRLVVRRASNILRAYLGESEQLLAAAFRDAGDKETLLLFDEADSFLRDRRDTRYSWEVTLVNEFLQQLEASVGLVACTTNRFDGLDPAALRRFTFKVRFGPLTPSAASLLFRRTLTELGSADHGLSGQVGSMLATLTSLTAGDFATVTRRLRALGEVPSADQLFAELQMEHMAKHIQRRQIGFS